MSEATEEIGGWSRGQAAALAGAALALAAGVAHLLVTAVLPLGAWNWAWALRTPARPWGTGGYVALGLAVIVAMVAFEWVRAPREPSRRTCAWVLALLVPLALGLGTAIHLNDVLYPVEAPLVVLSEVATGYYTVAAESTSVGEVFAEDLARLRDPALPDRVRTHPPGPIVLMLWLREWTLAVPGALPGIEALIRRVYGFEAETIVRLTEPSTSRPVSSVDALIACPIGWLMTLLPALIFLPVYGLGATLANRKVGLAAAALALGIPSLWVFLPGIDGLGALLALTGLYLWAAALRGGQWWRYALAGLGAALMLLWSYGYLALAPVALLLAWPRGAGGRARNLAAGLVYALVVFVVIFGLLAGATGYNLLSSMLTSLRVQGEIMEREQRDYLTWLWFNPYAFVLFLGPGLWPGLVAAVAGRRGQPKLVWRLAEGTVLTLLLLVVMGSTRGEVERIWVFLMPLLVVPVAAALTRVPRELAPWVPAAILVAQTAFAMFLLSTFYLVTAA